MAKKEENILCGPEPIFNYSESYLTLGHFILENLKKHGDKICMIDALSKEELTFKQLLESTIQTAESLKLYGLKTGDAISICSENHIYFFIPVIAALYLGITVAPLNHNYTKSELLHCLTFSQPKIVFCSTSVAETFVQISETSKSIKCIVTLDRKAVLKNTVNLQQFISVSVRVKHINTYRAVDFNPEEVVGFILCSSGTTGFPKGVMLTHRNLLVVVSINYDPRFDEKQTSILAILPLFHIYGLTRTTLSINQGGLTIIVKKFELKSFLQCIQDYKIRNLVLVPPILLMLAKSPLVNEYDLSSVKQITSGAAPLSKSVEEEIKNRFKLKALLLGYGMTETAGATLKSPNGSAKSGTIGKLMPFLKCKVCDLETGKAVGCLQRGEMWFKGPQIMKGYCGDENATKQCIDDDGWLHTGDVGYYDEDGYFYIVDRIKELIKYKGFQVAPAELEYLLLNNPCIKDAAVIGKPDQLAGELPTAFVVKEPGINISAAQVQLYIARQVSPQKRLHGGVIFVNEIPKNPSGKILRRKLREFFTNTAKL